MQTVDVPAAQFYTAVAGLGFPPQVSPPPYAGCEAGTDPGDSRMRFLMIPGILLNLIPQGGMPQPYDDADYTCRIRLFGPQLTGGWQFDSLVGTVSEDCSNTPDSLTRITKRTDDPADTTHDVILRDWGGITICALWVDAVRLTGPAGQDWKAALGF
jgi:hypothetical protein